MEEATSRRDVTVAVTEYVVTAVCDQSETSFLPHACSLCASENDSDASFTGF